jgi:hypothetical protein
VLVAGLLIGGKAFAFESECYTFPNVFIFSCETPLHVRPNPNTHTISMKIYTLFTSYQMRDAGNGIICREGSTGAGTHSENVWGLYNDQQGYTLVCTSSLFAHCGLNN